MCEVLHLLPPNLILLRGCISCILLLLALLWRLWLTGATCADLKGDLNDCRSALCRVVVVDPQRVAEDLRQQLPATELRHGHGALFSAQGKWNISTKLWTACAMLLLLLLLSLLSLLLLLMVLLLLLRVLLPGTCCAACSLSTASGQELSLIGYKVSDCHCANNSNVFTYCTMKCLMFFLVFLNLSDFLRRFSLLAPKRNFSLFWLTVWLLLRLLLL